MLAQRLARGLCRRCKEEYVASEDEVASLIEALGSETALKMVDPGGETKLYRGKGCEACSNSGYKGRIALHELLVNNDEIRHAVAQRAPVEQIRRLSIAGGMTTLVQDGIAKVLAGKTDLKQVRRRQPLSRGLDPLRYGGERGSSFRLAGPYSVLERAYVKSTGSYRPALRQARALGPYLGTGDLAQTRGARLHSSPRGTPSLLRSA